MLKNQKITFLPHLVFAPISCNLEREKTNTSPRSEPTTVHTKPSRSTKWAIWKDDNSCWKWWINPRFPLNLQLLGAASNRCNICTYNLHVYFTTNSLQRLQPKAAETKSCSFCNYQLNYSCTLVANICSVKARLYI